MKASPLALAAALSGLAAAGAAGISQNTHAYILRSDAQHTPRDWQAPPLPAPVARAVIHQRLSTDPHTAVPLQDLLAASANDDVDAEALVASLNIFGKRTANLFEDGTADKPAQLVVMVEGITEAAAQPLKDTFEQPTLFTIPGTFAKKEIDRLVDEELVPLGVKSGSECLLYHNGCRDVDSVVVRYDIKKDPTSLETLLNDVKRHRYLATKGIRETLFLFFPDTTTATTKTWSDARVPLRRRQAAAESVMTESDAIPSSGIQFTDDSDDVATSEDSTSPAAIFATTGPVPSCFETEDACKSGTSNCSSHGQCRNLWGPEVQGKDCWACHCLMSQDGTQWGGDVCQKVDISAQFWLLAGTSVVLIGIVGGVVGMLFSVGEERLPGVIGAGVSKK